MPISRKTGLPQRQSISWLAADALRSQLHRWPYEKPGDAIPLLYKFVDYGALVVGGNFDITVSTGPRSKCVSTNPDLHLRELSDNPFAYQREFAGDSGGQVHLSTRNGANLEHGEASRASAEIDMMIDLVEGGIGGRRGRKSSELCARVVLGLEAMTKSTRPPRTEIAFRPYAGGEIGDEFARQVLEAIAADVSQASRGIACPITFGIRSWNRDHWWLFAVSQVNQIREAMWAPFSPASVGAARAAFLSGFIQIERSTDGLVIHIPCHFGGVPWLLASYRCQGEGPAASLVAYEVYRDVASLVNSILRTSAQHSFVRELRREFNSAVAANSLAPPETIRRAISAGWDRLAAVYPIPAPTLISVGVRGAATQPDRGAAIEFTDGYWHVDLDHPRDNPFFATTPPLEGANAASWNAHGKELLKEFVREATEEIRLQQMKDTREVADATYVVGHPLKVRLSGLLGDCTALASHIATDYPSDQHAQGLVDAVEAQVRRCTKVAGMINLISSWRQAAARDQLHGEFLSDLPFDVAGALRGDSRTIQLTGKKCTVNLKPEFPAAGLCIKPRETRWGECRLADFVYEELFAELIVNAAKWGYADDAARGIDLHIRFDRNAGALIFSNSTRKKYDRVLHNEWVHWRDGQAGGLRFVSELLQITDAGSVHVQTSGDGDTRMFLVRLRLNGLSVVQLSARGSP